MEWTQAVGTKRRSIVIGIDHYVIIIVYYARKQISKMIKQYISGEKRERERERDRDREREKCINSTRNTCCTQKLQTNLNKTSIRHQYLDLMKTYD